MSVSLILFYWTMCSMHHNYTDIALSCKLKSGIVITLAVYFFFRIIWAILDVMYFHMKFNIVF